MSKHIHEKTNFGYREVEAKEKSSLVADVFRSVAPKYDLMNDLMSGGLHRLWKQFTIDAAALCPGQIVLDIASGTGDLALACAKAVGKSGKVLMTDINEAMLRVGRERMIDRGILENMFWVQADAEQLPFHDNYFDCITIAFGLRNVTHKDAALASMYRVLKPGGRALILEFSRANSPLLQKIYDAYSFNIIPKIGEWVTGDRESYQYLVESIRIHPDQKHMKLLLEEAGFEDVTYYNLLGGIVALHKGFKY